MDKIDTTSGVIRDVSLISKGEARGHKALVDASGNVTTRPEEAISAKPMFVDDTTLAQVAQCSNGTLKLRADHGSGVLSTIGYIDNIRCSGDKVLGDVYIYESEPERAKILEIAEKNPEHLALSLEFRGDDEVNGDKVMARCSELIAAALVNEGAANKSLFSANPISRVSLQNTQINTSKATSKIFMDDYANQLAEFGKRLACLEDVLNSAKDSGTAPKAIDPNVAPAVQNPDKVMADNAPHVDVVVGDKAKHTDPTEDEEKGEEKMKAYAALVAQEAIKQFAASIGVKHVPASGPASNEAVKVKTFSELVDEKTKEFGGDTVKATLFCIQNHKDVYKASRLISKKN
jgi:hypothetical protein